MGVKVDKPSLSRGLDAILNLQKSSFEDLRTKDTTPGEAHLREISVTFLNPGKFQPRKNFQQEDLNSLADSIAAQGIIQPLIVRQIAEDLFEIIAGERRWRAAKLAGLTVVPVVVRHIDDEVAAAFSLIENIQRKDLSPLEEALALQRLIDEFKLSHDEVATRVGRSRTAVTNMLRLLTLDEKVKLALDSGGLSMGHSRALVTLAPNIQQTICDLIIKKQLSVRQTEQIVRQQTQVSDDAVKRKWDKSREVEFKHWSSELANLLKAQVTIRSLIEGGFQLSLKVKSAEALEQLILSLLERPKSD